MQGHCANASKQSFNNVNVPNSLVSNTKSVSTEVTATSKYDKNKQSNLSFQKLLIKIQNFSQFCTFKICNKKLLKKQFIDYFNAEIKL